MNPIEIHQDDPTSTANPSPEVIDIRADGELTEHDSRELWLSQYRLRLFLASRRANRLRAALGGIEP